MKVVLLHAFPLDERMWEPQLDSPGRHDLSSRILRTRRQLGGRLGGAGPRDGPGDLIVVGASLGGYVALAMARLARRVRGLLLAAPARRRPAERRAARAEMINVVEEEGIEGSGNQREFFADRGA